MSYDPSPQPLLGSTEDEYQYNGGTHHGSAKDNTKLHEMAQITAVDEDDIEMKRPPYIHVSRPILDKTEKY